MRILPAEFVNPPPRTNMVSSATDEMKGNHVFNRINGIVSTGAVRRYRNHWYNVAYIVNVFDVM